jgi:hypothetical protein
MRWDYCCKCPFLLHNQNREKVTTISGIYTVPYRANLPEGGSMLLRVPCYRCKECGRCIRVLPQELHPHCNHLSETIIGALDYRLFRFGIIFPLISMRPEDGPLGARIDEICSREHHIPHSTKTTLSPGTVRECYYTYREKGTIDSLAPAGRSDRGKKRTISRESTDRLLAMRGEYPAMPVTRLVEKAVSEGVFAEDGVPSMSTIYAIMKEAACSSACCRRRRPSRSTS